MRTVIKHAVPLLAVVAALAVALPGCIRGNDPSLGVSLQRPVVGRLRSRCGGRQQENAKRSMSAATSAACSASPSSPARSGSPIGFEVSHAQEHGLGAALQAAGRRSQASCTVTASLSGSGSIRLQILAA